MEIILLSLVIIAASAVPGFAPSFFAKRFSIETLGKLTGVASGLLLASAILIVLPEGFHLSAGAVEGKEAFANEPLALGMAILGGFIFMLILEGLGVGHAVHEEHHGHEEGHGHEHIHHPTSGPLLTIGLSVHALADGVAVGAAAASGNSTFSSLVAIGIIVHRIPAALSLGLFSLHQPGGRKTVINQILMFTAASPVALIISYFALENVSDSVLAFVLLFSAGTFIYVATVDTLPEIHNPETGKKSARNVAISAVIFSVLILLLQSFGIEHSHDHEDHHEMHGEHDEHASMVII